MAGDAELVIETVESDASLALGVYERVGQATLLLLQPIDWLDRFAGSIGRCKEMINNYLYH